MRFIRRYRLSSFLQSSIWLVPILGMLLALVLNPILREIDEATGWAWLGFGPNGSRALLGMIAASMLSFLVFLFSALLIAVQLASAQLTPRVIAPSNSRSG
jgi:uncharacterized membrane protein